MIEQEKILNRMLMVFGLWFLMLVNAQAQNCLAFLYQGDTLQYEGCMLAAERSGHYQFSRAYQEALDRGLEKCDYFSFGYKHKSIAYLKSGDFITWKKLIDKAVALDPLENIGYRGWCRYQFFKDYKGAIKDIEQLDTMISDIGYSQNGVYHLKVALGLWYKALGQKEKALSIIEAQLAMKNHQGGLFDYLHLGVLYLDLEQYEKAIEAFGVQSKENELAENQFYLALAFKSLGDLPKYKIHLQQAKKLYEDERRMFDDYSAPIDKIYLQVIENEIQLSADL